MKLAGVLMLATVLTVGCTSLTETIDDLNELLEAGARDSGEQSPEVVVAEAERLKKEGSWYQAISMFRKAVRRYPGNLELQTLLSQLEQEWELEKRHLDNQLLFIEGSGVLDRLPLMEKKLQGDPRSQILKSRILYWQSHLEGQIDNLTRCGVEEEQDHIQLARKCLDLANRIDPSPENQARLDGVSSKIEAIRQAAIAEQEKRERRQKALQIRRLLLEAEQERQRGSLNSAMAKLNEALRRDPENPEVRALLSEVQKAMNSQASVLIQLGDRLYREEQAGPAIAVWEAALKLDPNQPQVTERISRARKVYEKLESIRGNEN